MSYESDVSYLEWWSQQKGRPFNPEALIRAAFEAGWDRRLIDDPGNAVPWPRGAGGPYASLVVEGLPPGTYELERVAGAPGPTLAVKRIRPRQPSNAAVPHGPRATVVIPPPEDPGTPPDIASPLDRGPRVRGGVPEFICDVCGGRDNTATVDPNGPITLDCAGCPNTYSLADDWSKWNVKPMWAPGIARPDPATFNMVAAQHFLDAQTRRVIVSAGMKGVALEMVQDGNRRAAIVWWENGEKVTADNTEAYILKVDR